MQNAIINGLCRLSISCSHDYQCDCRALIISAKPKTTVRYVGRMTDAVVYKLYSHRPLSTAANQQLAVSTGTIATYFGNLAPPRGCLHAEVHELCVRVLSADISARRRSLRITRADISACRP